MMSFMRCAKGLQTLILGMLLCVISFPVLAEDTLVDNRANLRMSIEYQVDWVAFVDYTEAWFYVSDFEYSFGYLNPRTGAMMSDTFYQGHRSPLAVSEAFESAEDLMEYLNLDSEWTETTINEQTAYQATVTGELKTEFYLIYKLADETLSYSVLAVAVDELTEERITAFVEVIETITLYTYEQSIEDITLTEEAESTVSDLVFEYPEDWYLSSGNLFGVAGFSVSPHMTDFDRLMDEELFVSVMSLPIDILNTPIELPHEMSPEILSFMAQQLQYQGATISEADLIDVDEMTVGKIVSRGVAFHGVDEIMYLLVIDDELIIVSVNAYDEAYLELMTTVAEMMIPTIRLDS